MRCPTLQQLPPPPPGKSGWPWTEESQQLPETTDRGTAWPKVSIVTPSYNQGRFLEESIRSVLLQGYPDLEYILIDGGSTDESVEIIQRYEPWLTYWVSEPDRGQSHALNKGLEKSTGAFFNWHNGDDLLAPDALGAAAIKMLEHPEAGSVHGYRVVIDIHSTPQFDNRDDFKGREGFVLSQSWCIANLKTHCQPGCLMNRSLVVEAGMIDENLHYVMDIDLSLRLVLMKPQYYIDQPMVFFRQHPEGKSSATKEKALERLAIARKIFCRRDLPPHIASLKKESFATAHRFARTCYADADMYLYALWHVLCEMPYLPYREWGKQKKPLLKFTKRMVKSLLRRGTHGK